MLGRARETEELARGLEDARAGRGRFLFLVGEPGIGKTRLCDEATAAAARAGVPVLWGRAWEAGGAPAYWPWMEVLAGLCRR
ncbi:MAG: ATP-binding protein, partial [Polyangia bacterium]